jgi:SUZ domain
MPQLVVTSSRTGPMPSSVVVPPASAFQSPIRILKRTVAPTQQCVDVDSPTSTMTGTFAERSARYNAARERIFANTTKDGVGQGGAVTAIVRNPKGPEHAQDPDGQGSQGFGIRVGKRGNTNQPSEQATDSGTWGGQGADRL